MTRFARRALSALTATALLAGLLVGTPGAVRAVANTQYVAVEGTTYSGEHAADCNSPDYTVNGSSDDEQVALAVTAADGGTVFFCAGAYYFTSSVYSDEVELVGADADSTSISGSNTTRIFGTESNVVLSGLTLRDAYSSDEGGAIAAGGSVVVTDAVFEDNFTLKGGGAIAAGDDVTVINSVFSGNSTTDRGGAIATFGYVAILSSEFTNNSSIADENCVGGGGAIAASDDVFVNEGSTFSGNTAVLGEVTDVEFCNDEGIYGGKGGAILTAEYGLIYDSTFSDNSAAIGGGAIYALALLLAPTSDPYGVIDGSQFSNNTILNSSADDVEGGNAVLQRNDELHISGSSFTSNTGLGSAVMVEGDDFGGTAVVTNSNFSDNTGVYSGAIGAKSVSVSGSTFSRNSALWSGGAITAEHIDIESSSFTRNSALRGGAIFYCDESSIRTTNFARNTASKVSAGEFGPPGLTGLGGAVAGYGETLTLIRNTFSGNRADVAGGAVWFESDAPSSLAVMSKNRFTNNRATRTGGAVGYALNFDVPSRSDLRSAQRQNRFSGNHGGRGGIFGGYLIP